MVIKRIARYLAKTIWDVPGDNVSGWVGLWGDMGAFRKWLGATSLWGDPQLDQLEDAYTEHPVVRACVQEISSAIPKARLEVGRYMGDEWMPLPSHPALDVIENPGGMNSMNDVLQYMSMRIDLTGLTFNQKIRGKRSREIAELWPLPSNWVRAENERRDGSRMFAGYRVHGQKALVPVEDMLVGRMVDPSSTAGASSPFRSAYKDYLLDNERMNYLAEMLINLKIPGLIFETEKPMSPKQREEIGRDLQDRCGRGQRGNPLIVTGAKVRMENPLGDMDWPGFSDLNEARLCMAFGVPPILIGARLGLNRATYANYKEARKSFAHETLATRWDFMGEILTFGMLRQEGEFNLDFRFRYDELPEFQEDADARANRAVMLDRAELITLEEGRTLAGFDPDKPETTDTRQRGLGNFLGMSREGAPETKAVKVLTLEDAALAVHRNGGAS